jgi:uncharacterized protein (DUF433 family)
LENSTGVVSTYSHIVRRPDILEGEPTVAGTRVPVRAIVLYFRIYRDLDRLGHAFPMLTRAALEEALDFYQAHTEEIDRYIAENQLED